MKKYFPVALVAVLILALVFVTGNEVFSADPVPTRSKSISTGKYQVAKTAWTSTTGVDSVLIVNHDSTGVDLSELTDVSRMLSVQWEVPDSATASLTDKIVVWFVSNQPNPVGSIRSGPTWARDWSEVSRDTLSNKLAGFSQLDVGTYSARWACALIYDQSTATAAQAEAAYLYYPKRGNEAIFTWF